MENDCQTLCWAIQISSQALKPSRHDHFVSSSEVVSTHLPPKIAPSTHCDHHSCSNYHHIHHSKRRANTNLLSSHSLLFTIVVAALSLAIPFTLIAPIAGVTIPVQPLQQQRPPLHLADSSSSLVAMLHEPDWEQAMAQFKERWNQEHSINTPNQQISSQLSSKQVSLDLTKNDQVATQIRLRRSSNKNVALYTEEMSSDDSRIYHQSGDVKPSPSLALAQTKDQSKPSSSSLPSTTSHSHRKCSSCTNTMEESQRIQIENIKTDILNKLGMRSVPNITKKAMPKIPPLRHLFANDLLMQGDSADSASKSSHNNHDPFSMFQDDYFGPVQSNKEEEHFFVNAEKSVVFAQAREFCLGFVREEGRGEGRKRGSKFGLNKFFGGLKVRINFIFLCSSMNN